MTVSNQYGDYTKRSFLGYLFSIINLLFVLVGLFLFVSVEWISAGGNKKDNVLLTEILDRQVGDYEKGLVRSTSDYGILGALEDKDSSRVTEVNRLLYEFSTRQPIRCSFVLTDGDGIIVSSNLFEGDRDTFLSSTVYQSSFKKVALEPDKIFTLPSRLNCTHGQKGDLILSRVVSDSLKVLRYLFFDLSDEQIYETVRNYPLDDVILTGRYDNLIFSIGRWSADPMKKCPAGKYKMEWKEGNVIRVNGKHYHVQKEMLPESTLILYILVPMGFQRTLISYGILFLDLVDILMLVMIPPLAFQVTRRNLEAIDELQTSVAEIGRGNMGCKLGGQVLDKFRVLEDAFRKMVLQREELMPHNSELAEHKRVMEIRQLEEQFNLHFIFNVLETLRYEIVIGGAKASDMVMTFVDLIRYSICYGSTIVLLQTDIEDINDYLLLQKVRYNKWLNYHIDIPEELLGCRIPKLLLQSAVENSLVHEMEDIHSVFVTISTWIAEGNLKSCMEDNGSGISKEELEEFREGLEREDICRGHIGLCNFHRVVRLLYGPTHDMAIDSNPGKGTRAVTTPPAEVENGYV